MGRTAEIRCLLILLGFNLCVNLVQAAFANVGVKYQVTLNVFSGRENPEWEVDETNSMYQQLSWAVNSERPTDIDERHMGYQGFVVRATNAHGQTAWKTVGRYTSRRIESILLKSCPSSVGLSPQLVNHVNAAILGQLPQTPQPKTVSKAHVTYNNEEDTISVSIRQHFLVRRKRQAQMCATRFAPENWNYASVQRRNNCYNYATNMQTNTFAQPGRASGRRYTQTTPQDVYAASLRDGLTPLSIPDAGRECLIALVIWPGEDYHYLRLDNDGTWSQKSGRTRARNTDDSGFTITDPRMADTGPYTVFAGFLGVGPNANIR
ncbi:uncharacterized protein LOC127836350 [Dreissena polymorpha]|uniref:Uncharacterized protein n=1 Tax=Dreissena polymorpha TaxID=45954 RepID=A0A9D4GDI5_DREPO|nr:uncharacterized protein LOC127836350 [Dreissena polymorpha]KAH3813599.1 hypothetical protein DPMN_142063 [Dreissena polymorpha]